MIPDRLREPSSLQEVQADGLYRNTDLGRTVAARMRGEAAEYLAAAEAVAKLGMPVAAAGNLHEAARLAMTALAADRQYGLRSEGTHKIAIDYGLGVGAINRAEWAALEELRLVRNANNYQADQIAINDGTFARIADVVRRLVTPPAPKRTIPPPPPPSLR